MGVRREWKQNERKERREGGGTFSLVMEKLVRRVDAIGI